MKTKPKFDHPDNPFLWRKYPRPSMFMEDPYFRAPKGGKTLSQASSEQVERAREKGQMTGFIKGISKNREEEILRIRNFTTFTLAVLHAPSKQQTEKHKVPNVRSVDKRTRDKDKRED